MLRAKWIECYSCGCSSEADRKRDLLGYCGTHGNERQAIYPPSARRRVSPEDARKQTEGWLSVIQAEDDDA